MNKNSNTQSLPAAIYSRVSSEEQKKGETINAHIAELKTFLEQEGNYLWDSEKGVYKDEAYSGAVIARPELDRLRDDAKADRYQVVYFLHPDRLARDNHYIGLVITELKRHGIKITFKNTPVADDPQGDLMLNIYGSFAQYERAVIADRSRRGRRYKAEVRKLIVGAHAPYGLRYVKKDAAEKKEGYYELIPDEIAIVKKIFQLVDEENFTARQVARWLTENKVPTRKGNGVWGRSSVLRILKRAEYIGIAYYNKYESVEPKNGSSAHKYKKTVKSSRRLRPMNEWIAIPVDHCKVISNDRFKRVQETLRRNKILSKRNTKNQYLLRQLLYCKSPCNCLWRGQFGKGKLYYRCSNREKMFPLSRTCTANTIRADAIEPLVWRAFCNAVCQPKLIMEQIGKLQKHARDHSATAENIALEEKCLAALERAEQRIFDAYKAGVIDIKKLQEETNSISAKRQTHHRALDKLVSKKKEVIPPQLIKASVSAYCEFVSTRLADIEKDFNTKQAVLRDFIREGVVENGKVTFKCKIACNVAQDDQEDQGTQVQARAIRTPYPYTDGIVNTTPRYCGHNKGKLGRIMNTTSNYCGHNTDVRGFIFKLIVDTESMTYRFTE